MQLVSIGKTTRREESCLDRAFSFYPLLTVYIPSSIMAESVVLVYLGRMLNVVLTGPMVVW